MIFLMIGTGIHAAFESRKAGRKAIWQWLAGLFLGGCIMLFVFVINCGINYHRESFSEKSGLKIQTYSVKDLQATCQWLTEEVNRLSTQVERTENGELQLPEEIRQEAVRSMQALGRQYPALQGYYPNPKPVLVSEILSYQKLMGIYAPFTIEANYNQDMPSYDFPFTMCHELSHLRGFYAGGRSQFYFISGMQGVRHDRISVQWNAVCVGVRHECSIQGRSKSVAGSKRRSEQSGRTGFAGRRSVLVRI